jgi:hypothetical protein
VLIGGDTGQSAAGNGHNHLVHQRELGGTAVWCGWWGRPINAPCWVLKEQPWAGDGRLLFQHCQARLGSHTARVSGVGVGVVVVGWLLVENCTVDASILFSVVCCVVKLSRADGGCLGTRSR